VVPADGVTHAQVLAAVEKAGGKIVKSTGDGEHEYHLVEAKDDKALKKCYETLSGNAQIKIVQYNQQYKFT
jgi:hypothetical protein